MTEEGKVPANIIIAIIVITILAVFFILPIILNAFIGRTTCKIVGMIIVEIFFKSGPFTGLLTQAGVNVGCDLLPF